MEEKKDDEPIITRKKYKSRFRIKKPLPDCSICLKKLGYQKRKYLPCGHFYHFRCIDKWIKNNNSCCLCREPVYEPEVIFFFSNDRKSWCDYICLSIYFLIIIWCIFILFHNYLYN